MLTRSETLTAEGAQLLRDARDRIVADPLAFYMGEWDCGSFACIGGHCDRILCETGRFVNERSIWAVLLGSQEYINYESPLYALFFAWKTNEERDVAAAVERINAVLWSYGFPPDELRDQPASSPCAPESSHCVFEGQEP